MRGLGKILIALSLLAAGTPLHAQQGHPLVGSWSGYWESGGMRHRVLLLFAYDGDAITGVINPGRSPAPLSKASLNPDDWTLVLEGDRKDAAGTVHIVIEGRIEHVTSTTERAIVGTWTEGETRGTLRVTLN
jgi:hypothetical protein